jgi:hypothetical protein
MGVIKIPERTSDNFGDPISKLLNIQLEINNLNPDTEKQFDFSECKFFNPYLLGGITSIYQNEISKNNKITIRLPNSFTIKEYLNTIHFPHGFPYNPNEIENFQIALNYFDTKTYIPIVFFPATNPAKGSGLPVAMETEELEKTFYLGDMALSYTTELSKDGKTITTTFTVDDKGFVDANNLNPFQKDDNAGPNNELGGTPYDYKPVTWSETYKNPGYKAGENGKPLPVNKNNDNKNDKKK